MASFKDSLQEGQTHIKSKAAVAWGPGEPLKMEEVDVELQGRSACTHCCNWCVPH